MEQVVTLDNIAGGAVKELFQRAFDEVLDNIADVNTEPEKKREIHVKVVIEPNEKRETGAYDIKVETKLAGARAVGGTMYFGTIQGAHVAVDNDPKQRGLFDEGPSVAPTNGERKDARQ